MPLQDLTNSDIWKKLEQHQQALASVHMQDLFAENPNRFDQLSCHKCHSEKISHP